MPKDYSATGSNTGRAAPELLLNFGLLVFLLSSSVQRSDLFFIFLFLGVWYHITFGTLTPMQTLYKIPAWFVLPSSLSHPLYRMAVRVNGTSVCMQSVCLNICWSLF